MDKVCIYGGLPLNGTVRVSGAKNACMAMMAAALLTEEPCILRNVPQLRDVDGFVRLLQTLGVEVEAWQSNHEGEIVDKIQSERGKYDGMLINAGGYTHTSVVIRDAIAAVQIPTVEIHMTNIHAREEFRHTSLLSGVCIASVIGFKEQSYLLALEGLVKILSK